MKNFFFIDYLMYLVIVMEKKTNHFPMMPSFKDGETDALRTVGSY